MPDVRPAAEMAERVDAKLDKIQSALAQLETFRDRLRNDSEFQNLWNSDSAAALREVGIDPDARTEMGYPPYDDPERGPMCEMCWTPNGNLCHC